MIYIENMIGVKFNSWTIVEYMGVKGEGRKVKRIWRVKCDCNREFVRDIHDIKRGKSKRCNNCYIRQTTLSHGYNRRGMRKPEYTTWTGMKDRCLNPSNDDYIHYGGRGITIEDDRWLLFENFILDMGDRPGKGYSIDRRDNNRGYCLENCYWATQSQQMKNTRLSLKNKM